MQTENKFEAKEEGKPLPEKVQQFIREAILPPVRKNLADSDQLMPIAYVVNANWETGIVMMDMGQNGEDKDKISLMLKKICKEHAAVLVITVMECWVVKDSQAEDFMRNRDKYPTVESYPGRIDGLSILVESTNGQWAAMQPIKNGPNGKRTFDEPEFQSTKSQGRFVNNVERAAVVH